jgi:hypothetical protein
MMTPLALYCWRLLREHNNSWDAAVSYATTQKISDTTGHPKFWAAVEHCLKQGIPSNAQPDVRVP